MCGIVGIAHRQGREPVSAALIESMCTSIQHRGPDGMGTHVVGGVGLGMRRLSIIDLQGGRQPISNEDGSVTIVFNGEIYNYRELRAGLEQRGHVLRTHSDTETIVHLYEELGERCVEPLRGMFAFAIWDERRRRLLLARDRFGIKPLYVTEADWGIAFASELKALHAAGMTGQALDWDGLDIYMQLGYLPAPYSPFREVRKLPPAHTLCWHDGQATLRRYWDLPRGDTPPPPDIEEKVREWLDDSVAAHLESDVPVAAFLSGGLDSSAVVSSMAMANGAPHAFTVRFTGTVESDEVGLAQQLADRHGARLTVIDVAPHVGDVFEQIIHALDEPHADESAIPSWLLSREVAREYKVALAGTGGDELFGGYRRHIGLLLGEAYTALPAVVQRATSRVADSFPESRAGLGVSRVKRFLRARDSGSAARYLELMTRLHDDQRAALYTPELAARRDASAARNHFNQLHADGGSPTGLRAALYLDYKTYLPDDILALSDRMSMAHSLEVRVPLVDHELVGHVFALPDRAKIGYWRPKQLLRRALAPRLPRAHFRAPKRGFVGPTAAWLRLELRDMITDELSPDRVRRLGYFDPAVVTRLLNEHLDQRQNREGILWNLLCFSAWHRQYMESAPAPYRPR